MDLDKLIAQITNEVCSKIQFQTNEVSPTGLADSLEYTLIDPRLTVTDIIKMCETAKSKNITCICVAQWFVDLAKQQLKGTNVNVSTCIGLPGGNSSTAAKYAEVKEAVKNGADEVDIPINMELAINGDFEGLKNDLEEAMVPAKNKAKVKAVIELGQLSDEKLEKAVQTCVNCGADYISVSSILSGRAHEIEEVKRVASICGNTKIKAVGKIQDSSKTMELLKAGVLRIGTSAAIAI